MSRLGVLRHHHCCLASLVEINSALTQAESGAAVGQPALKIRHALLIAQRLDPYDSCTEVMADNPLAKLELPRRWELLQQRSAASGIDPALFVERVDDAARRIDYLLSSVRTRGGGLFEIFLGLSGSGKTTFLQTLPRFFDNVRVHSYPSDRPLEDLPKFVRTTFVASDDSARIVLVERRDNPSAADFAVVEPMLAALMDAFRTPEGAALVLWPITRSNCADEIAEKAWLTGRDSVVEPDTKGIFRFVGLPKERFYEIADTTTRNLAGDNLEAFGVTRAEGNSLLPACETISDFYAAVQKLADSKRDRTWSVLRERAQVHLWVVLPGDLTELIDATTSALTSGIRSRIDIDLVAEFVDLPSNSAIYISNWKARRGLLAHLIRSVDLRLFSFPPNVALAAVRSYGDASLKGLLKQPAVNEEQAKSAMRACRLYKAILAQAKIESSPFAGARGLSDETAEEYRRIQAVASRDDTPLNKAVGLLIEACLKEDAPALSVKAEKRSLPSTTLQPDIQIQLGPNEFICLEPTWRVSNTGTDKQSTLGEAHIKKYVLEKADQYVQALGL